MANTTGAALLLQRIRRRKEDMDLLVEIYIELFEGLFEPHGDFKLGGQSFLPNTKQFELWLRKYDTDLIAEALDTTASKFREKMDEIGKLQSEGRKAPAALNRTPLDVIKYASATMRDMLKELNTEDPNTTTEVSLDGPDEQRV